MKVLVINGSPKEKSDTMCLTNAFLKGLNEKNEHEIKILDVIKMNIKPCLGCFKCWKNEDGECVQKDDQKIIMDEYQKSDIIIWSFPLYSYAMPSHLKAVVDRLIPFNKMTMKEVDGHIVHVPRVNLHDKHVIFICGCGFPNFDGNFDGLDIMIKNKFSKHQTSIYVSEAPMLNEEEAKPLTEPLLIKFTAAGRFYNEHLFISDEIKKGLETPMLAKEEYIKIVNSLK